MAKTLGSEIRRLRLKAGFTLRGFAEKVGISAAHQSDIEHNRRLPSDKVLEKMAHLLSSVGASLEEFKKLDARFEPELEQWVQETPAVGELLRQVRAAKSPQELLRRLQDEVRKRGKEEE